MQRWTGTLSVAVSVGLLAACDHGSPSPASPDFGADISATVDLASTPDRSTPVDSAPMTADLGPDQWPAVHCPVNAARNTVGLTHCQGRVSPGYTLFMPSLAVVTYLVDIRGNLVNRWKHQRPSAFSAYLLPDGHLLRATLAPGSFGFLAPGRGGRIEKLSWDGRMVWQYDFCSKKRCHHHDIEPLPNGNILVLAWERMDAAEALAAGRLPAKLYNNEVWSTLLLELKPSGSSGATVVWQWRLWDHLVQDADATKANYGALAENLGRVDINYTTAATPDWVHGNGIHYDPRWDQIVISAHTMSEVWVVDHSTTTAQAKTSSGGRYGRGGSLLYRWGNPRVHGRGSKADQQLFGQHHPHTIGPGLPGAGNVLVFNNGLWRPGPFYSSVLEFALPRTSSGGFYNGKGSPFGPVAPLWTYTADPKTSLYSLNISGAQRLPNGNTLICEGRTGTMHEVTRQGALVWRYVNPQGMGGSLAQGAVPTDTPVGWGNQTFRAIRYPPSYAGLKGKDLSPKGKIEKKPD